MLSLLGKNKVQQEINWVNQKAAKGYKFKLLRKTKNDD